MHDMMGYMPYMPVNFDTVTLALYVTKLWAQAGMLLSKIFEVMFMCLIGLPESILKLIATCTRPIKNGHGETVKIVKATNGTFDITDKFRLFLAFYWEHGDEFGCINTPNFDFAKFRRLLNTSLLYCCYLLQDDQRENIQPDVFLKSVHTLFVEMKTKECRQVCDDQFTIRPLRDINFDAKKPAHDSFDADRITELITACNQ